MSAKNLSKGPQPRAASAAAALLAGGTPRWTEWTLLGLLAAAFTFMVLAYSLQRGRLALDPTFDDITYLLQGLDRLDLYQQQGAMALVRDYFVGTPHSPVSVYAAALAFGIFERDAASPYILNGLIVFALLACCRYLLKEWPFARRVWISVLVLTVPITALAVHEYRPDVASGLALAMGAALLLRRPLAHCTRRYACVTGLCFGFAALSKPTAAPLVFVLGGSTLMVAILRDLLMLRRLMDWRTTFLRVGWLLGVAALLGLPHMLVNARYYWNYIYNALFANYQVYSGNALQHWFYYGTGEGSAIMLGGYVYALAIILAAAALLCWWNGVHWSRLLAVAAVAAVFYVVLALNNLKSGFIGAAFYWLLVLLSVLGLRYCADWLSARLLARAVRGAGAAVLLFAVWSFRWPALKELAPSGLAREPAVLSLRLGTVWLVQGLEKLKRSDRPRVFFATCGPYLNGQTLNFVSRVRGPNHLRVEFESDDTPDPELRRYQEAWKAADFVLAGETGCGEHFGFMPSERYQSQALALLLKHPDFALAAERSTILGKRLCLFQRRGGPGTGKAP